MDPIRCTVEAYWDDQASVWTASSEDVPGLATEADTLEALTEKLRDMIPELLQLNGVSAEMGQNTVAWELISHRQEQIRIA
ncbi:DUF1902 domain-containing protein [Acaryochloris sp. IP29b_bin.137]|uniref:DUF1902 domain-containing protein n=1 Tax=Acaryochloris sp. IP29b_bin.137 TaxID=2969217 RepID=UPI0026130997|nr:DUF1902 domain-containing protein [Acaryochloris sp. IP29b_bin.137]